MSKKGYDIDWIIPASYAPQDAVSTAHGYEAIIAGGEKYDRWALEQLSDSLRIIVRHGTGIDNIDLATASDLGIAVTNTAGKNARAVAEHALGMMLALTRKIALCDRELRKGNWCPAFSRELYGKTIGIIGYGAIGQWLAKLLRGFDCEILAYDLRWNVGDDAPEGAKVTDMDDLLSQSDFVSLHIPLTPQTENSIGIEFFQKMKQSAFFVNTARGKLVREDELIRALQDGIISGACLDVFANAPIDGSHPLCGMDDVVLTPHCSAGSAESMNDTLTTCTTSLIEFFSGKIPSGILNADYLASKNKGV
ncbi:MAG: NAD(P)-dependent oxidoreductase [Armatimonadota bacterium]|nr:hypothetical protein [bacterium]